MAYHFDGVDDRVEFAINPLSGYTSGAFTLAQFFKRGVVGNTDYLFLLSNSTGGDKVACWIDSGNIIKLYRGGSVGSIALASTSLWYLCVFTVTAGGLVRFHLHNGTSWSHTDLGSLGANSTIISSDRMTLASAVGSNYFNGDIVCSGVKKADASDIEVETLSRTAFSSWRSFGFDWLVGWDSSLVSGGLLQDQATPGTGDEISKVGTSVVSDPPGWLWSAIPTTGSMSKIKFGTGLGVTDEGAGVIRVDAPSSVLTLLNTVTLASPGVFNISGIPGSYKDLIAVLITRAAAGGFDADNVVLNLNGDSGANYYLKATGGTDPSPATAFGVVSTPGSNAVANAFGYSVWTFPGYSSSVWNKIVQVDNSGWPKAGAAIAQRFGGAWNSTAAITQLVATAVSGSNFATGSQLRLYGRT